MNVIDSLKPHESQRVIDLVAAAGVDVTPWGVSSKGKVEVPASNPAYCYEWAFTDPGKLIVLNVWHRELKEGNGIIWCDINPRGWAENVIHSNVLQSSERRTLSKRALRMDEAIAIAHKDRLSVRVIIGEGSQRNLSEPKSKVAYDHASP
jgi:5-methylcytosine-specific restriction protein A